MSGTQSNDTSNFVHRLRRWSAMREDCGGKMKNMINTFSLMSANTKEQLMKQYGPSVSSAAQSIDLVQQRYRTYGELCTLFEDMNVAVDQLQEQLPLILNQSSLSVETHSLTKALDGIVEQMLFDAAVIQHIPCVDEYDVLLAYYTAFIESSVVRQVNQLAKALS